MVQQQIDLFSAIMPTFKIDRKVRLIELFAGIGSQAAALKRLGVDMEHWRVVEWDKYAMLSYNAVHGTNFETSDIQKIHASDLGIAEREVYLHPYLFLSMPGLIPCRKRKGDVEGKWDSIWTPMGSREDPGRV